ncbi:MAG: glycosyltransferase family 2 protein, partial [Atopobiaceae bacterium]|nr:glycosyltransferase family 2 protein [Atopobiaceae bacterium]
HAERNRGDGPSRNAGLEQVTGEWLVLLDSDDLLEKGALALIADHIRRSPKTPDVYITRYFERDVVSNARWRLDECFPDEYVGKGPIDPATLADHLFSTVRSVIANKVWNIDYLRRNKLVFQDIPRVGDVFFTLGTLAQADTIEFLDVELYEYRLNHGTSLTSTGDRYPSSFAEAAEALHAFLDERGLLDVWETGYLNWFNENTFYNLVSMKTLPGFSELLSRLQKTTFSLVRFGNLRREDAVSQADYDRNVLLQDQSVDEVLFSGLRMLFSSRDDQFYRAEYHLFNEVNSRREADWKIHLLKNELERANSSLSMKVGLAATLVPRKAKAALQDKKRQQATRTTFSTYANPFVSIIVPAFNVKPHLWECLDSILGQTFSDFELIIVDDGSTDGTFEECDDYARRDPRVTVVHQGNSGLSAARGTGLDLARGSWVAFVGADDRIHPEFLSTLLGAAIGTGSDAASCSVQRFHDGVPSAQPTQEMLVVRTGDEACEREWSQRIRLQGKLFGRSLLDAAALSVGAVNDDYPTLLRILSGCGSVAEVGKPLYAHYEYV